MLTFSTKTLFTLSGENHKQVVKTILSLLHIHKHECVNERTNSELLQGKEEILILLEVCKFITKMFDFDWAIT